MNADARAKELFLDALDLTGNEREAFVERETDGDPDLRLRVERLLGAHGGAEEVLGKGPGTWGGPRDPGRKPAQRDPCPGDRLGPYVILGPIGEGGFGLVYAAEQTKPVLRRVAVKLLKRGVDTRAVLARFAAERQALERMDHPGIANVLDAGSTDDGRPYFVMELVEGVPITEYCARYQLGLAERLNLFRSVCNAIQHAHLRGVVHRDIKPSNVLVSRVDGEPLVKVIDFGVAKATADDVSRATVLTREGHLVGTPAYMSPEQTEDSSAVDERSDVYSLGVLLYELLTGGPPFDLAHVAFVELLRIVREEDPPRPSARARQQSGAGTRAASGKTTTITVVPRDLDWITLRCLEKQPSRRYPSAEAVARDVSRFLSQEPVEAAPPSAWYRISKLARRHRAFASAVVSVFVALLLGVVGTSLGLVRARQANADLDQALELARHETERAREAEARAGDEAAEARHQAEIAGAINDFLNDDLLAAALPGQRADRPHDVTVRQLLDQASTAIEDAAGQGGRFASAPGVEAAVRGTIANAYCALGHFPAAIPHLERRVELLRRIGGERDTERLSTLGQLAVALRRVDRFEEMEELLMELLEVERGLYGGESRETLESLRSLAFLRMDQGRYDDAVRLLEDVLAISREVLGDEDPDTLNVTSTLAIALDKVGLVQESVRMQELSAELFTRVHGPDSTITLGILNNLAAGQIRLQRYEPAAATLEKVLEAQERLLGPDHDDTLTARHNLSIAYLALGRIDEAEELAVGTYETLATNLGEEALATLRAFESLAEIQLERGDVEEAEEMLTDVVEACARKLGSEHPQTLAWTADLVRAVRYAGRIEEAARRTEDLLARLVVAVGTDHAHYFSTLVNHALLQARLGRHEVARRALEDVLARAHVAYGEKSLFVVRTRVDLAEVLLELDEPAEAETQSRAALEEFRELPEARPRDRVAARSALGASLIELGRLAEAEAALLEAWAGREEARPDVVRDVAERMARLRLAQGDEPGAAEWSDLSREP